MGNMTENVSVLVAFGGGLLSFLSPCVLPMVPVYLASLYGPGLESAGAGKVRVPLLLHSVGFVLGFAVVFVFLGAVAGLTGYAVQLNFIWLSRIAGILLVAFGAFMLLSLKVPWLNYEKRLSLSTGRSTGYLRSFLIGAAFSLGWTACVGPILGSILALASVEATAWRGAYLLAIYSLGLGIPFLVIAVAFDYMLPLLKRIHRYTHIIHIVSGCLLIAVGILLLTNNLGWFFSLAA
jgi:cytochrome c-type biogenesis protein